MVTMRSTSLAAQVTFFYSIFLSRAGDESFESSNWRWLSNSSEMKKIFSSLNIGIECEAGAERAAGHGVAAVRIGRPPNGMQRELGQGYMAPKFHSITQSMHAHFSSNFQPFRLSHLRIRTFRTCIVTLCESSDRTLYLFLCSGFVW